MGILIRIWKSEITTAHKNRDFSKLRRIVNVNISESFIPILYLILNKKVFEFRMIFFSTLILVDFMDAGHTCQKKGRRYSMLHCSSGCLLPVPLQPSCLATGTTPERLPAIRAGESPEAGAVRDGSGRIDGASTTASPHPGVGDSLCQYSFCSLISCSKT